MRLVLKSFRIAIDFGFTSNSIKQKHLFSSEKETARNYWKSMAEKKPERPENVLLP